MAEYSKVNKSVILSHVPLSILNLTASISGMDDQSSVLKRSQTQWEDTTSMFTDFNRQPNESFYDNFMQTHTQGIKAQTPQRNQASEKFDILGNPEGSHS